MKGQKQIEQQKACAFGRKTVHNFWEAIGGARRQENVFVSDVDRKYRFKSRGYIVITAAFHFSNVLDWDYQRAC